MWKRRRNLDFTPNGLCEPESSAIPRRSEFGDNTHLLDTLELLMPLIGNLTQRQKNSADLDFQPRGTTNPWRALVLASRPGAGVKP